MEQVYRLQLCRHTLSFLHCVALLTVYFYLQSHIIVTLTFYFLFILSFVSVCFWFLFALFVLNHGRQIETQTAVKFLVWRVQSWSVKLVLVLILVLFITWTCAASLFLLVAQCDDQVATVVSSSAASIQEGSLLQGGANTAFLSFAGCWRLSGWSRPAGPHIAYVVTDVRTRILGHL